MPVYDGAMDRIVVTVILLSLLELKHASQTPRFVDSNQDAEITTNPCVFLDLGVTNEQTLECTYHGSVAASSVVFSAPGQLQPPNGTLGAFTGGSQNGSYTYTGLTSSSDGPYMCTFTLENGVSTSKIINLAARQATLSSDGKSSKIHDVGSRLTLTCNVDASASAITWQFRSAANGAAFVDLDAESYSDITGSVNQDGLDESHTNSIIEMEISDNTLAGNYKCTGSYQSGECPTPQTFQSGDFTLTVTTQPTSASIPSGTDHSLSWVFPNPYKGSTPQITCYFNDAQILSSGKVYKNGKPILETDTVAAIDDIKINITLTLKKPGLSAAGTYKCSAKWGFVTKTSDPAVISMYGYSTHPTAANVVKGAAVTMSCVASGGSAATITFHRASDDTSVGEVTSTSSSSDVGVTETTATVELTSAEATPGYYYCSAVWNGGTPLRSNNAYIFVFDFLEPQGTVFGLIGHSVMFSCKTPSLLMRSSDEVRDDIDDITAAATVTWEYKKSGDSEWSDSANNKLFGRKKDYVVRTQKTSLHYITYSSITETEENMEVRCTAEWLSDSAKNFYGGKLNSPEISLNLFKVKEVSVSPGDHFVGDTLTFTCVAPAAFGREPTFTFTNYGRSLSASLFTVGSNVVSVTKSGKEYTATLEVEIRLPTFASGGDGINVDCNAKVGVLTVSKAVNVLTYYNCANINIEIRGKNDYTTMTKEDRNDGTFKATTICPAGNSTVKYVVSGTPGLTGATATCSKTTGKWDPPKLETCSKVVPYRRGGYYEVYNLENTSVNFTVCADDSTGVYRKDVIERSLRTDLSNETVCGARNAIECLFSNTCILDTNRTTCSYGWCGKKIRHGSYECRSTNNFDTNEYTNIHPKTLLITVGTIYINPTFSSAKTRLRTGKPYIKFLGCDQTYGSTSRRKRAGKLADQQVFDEEILPTPTSEEDNISPGEGANVIGRRL